MRRISIVFGEEAKALRELWMVRRSRISSEECSLWCGEDIFHVWALKTRTHTREWGGKVAAASSTPRTLLAIYFALYISQLMIYK